MQETYLPRLAVATLRCSRNVRLRPRRIRELQLRRFRRLATFASRESPFYREIVLERGLNTATCVPEDFPIITKRDVVEHFDQMVTDSRITREGVSAFLAESSRIDDLYLGRYVVIHTSGSSGTLGHFVYSPGELVKGLAPISRARRFGLREKLAFVGATRGHYPGATMINAGSRVPLLYKQVRLIDVNLPLPSIITELNRFQPTVLNGYAFLLRRLADAQLAGLLQIRPRLVQSAGETLVPGDADTIGKAFHAPLINLYASSEFLVMGIERQDFDGMYLMEDNLMFEFCAAGVRVTNLFNRTMPIIRYQLDDELRLRRDVVNRLPFAKVQGEFGRREQVPEFLTDADEWEYVRQILYLDFEATGLAAFQVVITGPRSFVYKAEFERETPPTVVAEMRGRIHSALREILDEKRMTCVEYSVNIVDQLAPEASTGKFRRVVRLEL